MEHQVLIFYKYVTIEDPKALAGWIWDLAETLALTGRIIVAEEGINATVEGLKDNTEIFAEEILNGPHFTDIHIKRSIGTGETFPKLSVKVREEIVGTHFPKQIDPRKQTAKRLKPEELKSWYENKEEFVILDMRNNYEFASGHFKDSIDPGLEASRDLPKAIKNLEPFKNKKVLTVCTGGIRCEKMSAYLLDQGFQDVHQLDGGIHSYMEKYPGQDFLGGLYTFDQRLVMNFGGEREVIGICKLCGSKTENYVNCKNLKCHLHFLACEDCTKGDPVHCLECLKSMIVMV